MCNLHTRKEKQTGRAEKEFRLPKPKLTKGFMAVLGAPPIFFFERGAKELTWALRKHILTSVKSGEKLDIKRYIKAPHLKGLNLRRLEKLPTPEALLPVGESNTTPLQTPENNRKGATLQCNNVVVWLAAG